MRCTCLRVPSGSVQERCRPSWRARKQRRGSRSPRVSVAALQSAGSWREWSRRTLGRVLDGRDVVQYVPCTRWRSLCFRGTGSGAWHAYFGFTGSGFPAFLVPVSTAVVSTALLASLLTVSESVAALPVERGGEQERAGREVLERLDAWRASLAARSQGGRVGVSGARSAVSRTWANPDGSFTLEGFCRPGWTRDAAGQWTEIDTTLYRDGESVRPAAAAVEVELSAGGTADSTGLMPAVRVAVAQDAVSAVAVAVRDGDVARMPASTTAGKDTAGFVVGWPGRLPTPVLEGPTATYRQVAPGRDLRIKALPGGIETYLDITEAPAGVSKNGLEVALPVSTDGLLLASDGGGGVLVQDARSKALVGIGGRARIWDAAIDPVSAEPQHSDGRRHPGTGHQDRV